MRILFIGCVESSKIFLNALIDNGAEIAGIITKKTSTQNSDFCDLYSIAMQKKIPCEYVKNINDDNSIVFIRKIKPDIGFCFGWSQLIQNKILDLFPKGVIGFHPAALPQNRGRHPLIWALALGLTQTASTFFLMNEKADAGDILSQEIVSIEYDDDARILYDKVMDVASKQLTKLWKELCDDRASIVNKENEESNTWRKRTSKDGKIDWRMSSRNIYNLVRALSEPYVGAHFEHDNEEYKVWKVKECINNKFDNIEPGKILWVNSDNSFAVKTGEGIIEVLMYDKFKPKKDMYL